MAGMRKKADGWHCTCRFGGKRYYFATRNLTEQQAKAKGSEVDETLDLIERGRLTVPEGVGLEDFVAAGGTVPVVSARPETITARQLFDHYLMTHGNETIEVSSLKTAKTHLNQVAETLEERFRIQALTEVKLQEHVERRGEKDVAAVTPKEDETEPFRTFAEIEAIIAVEKPDDDRKEAIWGALYLTRPEIEAFLSHVRQNATLPWLYPMTVFAA